ncbi:MAG: hypothetical protein OXC40_01245 [Proteobacteria bacterium]|nr:hypothetical protein [Pseudomonadota bacterium]
MILINDSPLFANSSVVTPIQQADPYEKFPLNGKASIKDGGKDGAHSAALRSRIAANVSEIYEILTDYKNFSQYMPHTKSCKVVKEKDAVKWVEYTLVFLVFIEVRYTLKILHELKPDKKNARIVWNLSEGEQFKEIRGYWMLEELPVEKNSGQPWTGVSYVSQLVPKVSIPRAIFDHLTKKSVYELFDAVRQRVEDQKSQEKTK